VAVASLCVLAGAAAMGSRSKRSRFVEGVTELMKKPSRFLRVVATLGMLAGLLAVFGATPAAAEAPFEPGIDPGNLFFSIDGAQEVYFPWVYNNDDFGLGEADGSVSIQNLTHADGYVFFYVGNGNGFDYTTYAFLAAGASKTFPADAIGVPEPGAPVVAGLYYTEVVTATTDLEVCEWEIGYDFNDDQDLDDCQIIQGEGPEDTYLIPLWAGGLVKSAVAGQGLPYTTSADTSVSGYNGLSGAELGWDHPYDNAADGVYLPIVQTNGGPGGAWDTRVTVANLGWDANAAVTLRFFPNDNDGSGSLNTGWQQNVLVNVGDVYQITLSDYVPTGWTGSVHILSDDLIGAIADRYKVGTDMWLTNIGSHAGFEVGEYSYCGECNWAEGGLYYPFADQYVLFAPTVYLDYNGWNTGFSVANLVETDNNVNIQYVQNGNAIQVVSQRIAPHGMITAYRPSAPAQDQNQQNPMYDQVAGALILSDFPVAAAVDAVKYFGNDQNVGQAMTYNATANLSVAQAMPLVQKGNPATGMGATSGLTLLNPLPIQNSMTITWLNQSGFNANNFGTSTIIVPAQAIGIAYTMTQHNLPNGYYGSAIVHANLPFTMTSGNVDYQVDGDGSVIWNGYNPCGLFRAFDHGCVWGWPDQPRESLLTKVVVDEQGNPIEGARVVVTGYDVNGDYFDGTGWTDGDGSVSFDVVAGEYDINVTDPPAGYMFGPGSDLSDLDIVIAEGQEITKTNVVNLIALTATITKTVVLETQVGPAAQVPLEGMTVAVYPNATCPPLGSTPSLAAALASGTTDANGVVALSFSVAEGGSTVCVVVLDASGTVVSRDLNLTYYPGDTDDILNIIQEDVELPATALKRVVVGTENGPAAVGVQVAIFPFESCPALGTTPNLDGALATAVTDANGVATLVFPADTVCIVVLDANGVVIDIDTDADGWTFEPGETANFLNVIPEAPTPGAILDIHVQGAPVGGFNLYVWESACPANPTPGTADQQALGERSSARFTVPAGAFCVGVDFDRDGDIDLYDGGTILAGDPAENGTANSDVVVRSATGGNPPSIEIQP